VEGTFSVRQTRIDTNINVSESVRDCSEPCERSFVVRNRTESHLHREKMNNKDAGLEGWDQSGRDARNKVSFLCVRLFIFRTLIAIRYLDASRILAIRERKYYSLLSL
jgi:hypothetical protein